ncbi:MAG: glyoxalase/bleomycin resistance/extradiol dioxygenase family protein [Thalassobius sp.]|nr:glyoxalase/bleomycin resistance/extradiol dioxygenase family protein [Thalassovita sp.]
MQKLKKIDAETNVITWFEIPVLDTERARTFYENILDIKMTTRYFKETNEELTFFPSKEGVIQATSGRVTGVLTKSAEVKPASKGTMVYLNASPSLQEVLDKVEKNGGKIAMPQIEIQAGLIAAIIDTEGNKVGLHTEK